MGSETATAQLIQYCAAHKIAIEAYSPLGGNGGEVLSNFSVGEAIAKEHNISVRLSLEIGHPRQALVL